MANEVRTYFLSPNWDILPPPSGPLRLGSILTDPAKPHRMLNRGTQIAIPDNEISRTSKEKWERSYAQLHEASVGVWASFMQIVGVGGDGSYNHKHDFDKVYKCESLETQEFRPSKQYIWDTLHDGEVAAYIEDTWYKRSVYMVTGLKIARGFSVDTKDNKKDGGKLKIGVDATSTGVPIQAGPKVKILYTKNDNVSFRASSNCVFAYQLVKIRSKKNGKFSEDDYNRGALLNTDEAEEDHRVEQFDEDWEVDDEMDAEEEGLSAPEQVAYEDDIM